MVALPAKQCSDCLDYTFYPLEQNGTDTMIRYGDEPCCECVWCLSSCMLSSCPPR